MDSNPNKSSCLASDALITTLSNSIQALGRGFDVTSDIRLLYCKGAPGSRLVHLDEANRVDLLVPDGVGVLIPNVTADIEISLGMRNIEATPVCTFHEVSSVSWYCLKLMFLSEYHGLPCFG